MDLSVNSVPIRTSKVKQYRLRFVLGRVMTLSWSAKGPKIWQREVLVDMCHTEVFHFANRTSGYESWKSISSVENQNCNGMPPDHPQGASRPPAMEHLPSSNCNINGIRKKILSILTSVRKINRILSSLC